MAVQITPPKLNINIPTPNKFITENAMLWTVLKVVGIIFFVGIVVLLLVAFIIWIINMIRPKTSIQRNLISKAHKSCKATKRNDIKKVYRFDDKGFHLLGEYLGDTTELIKSHSMSHILVGHSKIIPSPRAVHNFIFQINFIYTIPTKSLKEMLVNDEKVLLLLTSTLEYNLNSKSYVASDNLGLPKVINQVFLSKIDNEFNHEIINKIYNKLDKTIEMNPFVSAKIKSKQEFEKEDTENE